MSISGVVNQGLYITAKAVLSAIQILPLAWVARLGRWGGMLVYHVDARHRNVALDNLNRAFKAEYPPGKIKAIARENFGRIGENFASAIKTAGMSQEEIARHLTVSGIDKIKPAGSPGIGPCRMMAIGHFGNFELYAKTSHYVPGFQFATTYRGLKQPGLDRLLKELRQQSGCLFFERRQQAGELKKALNTMPLLLGLLADQHAGTGGTVASFFGIPCSTSPAPAIFALRYNCPLNIAICYRTGLAQWHIEVHDAIPTEMDGQPRSVLEITQDINDIFEQAVRRDPANWFWVHRRWKSIPKQTKAPALDRSAQAAKEGANSQGDPS